MNLYNLHKNPKSLDHYEDAQENVPMLAWEKYKAQREELKKREDLWARDAKYAYKYAKDVLLGPFPNGEGAIAKNAEMSYRYARNVLKRPFLKGEDVIATDVEWSYMYAENVLKGPFPKGEDAIAIATDPDWAYLYAKYILNGPFPKGELVILNSGYKNRYLELIGKLK